MLLEAELAQALRHETAGFETPPIKELVWMSLTGWVTFVLIGLLLGPDINTDSLHYHFYLADGFLGNHISRDFMGAGIQGYLSPYAYIPLAWMYRGQWSNIEAIVFIATVQSLVVPALWSVGAALLPQKGKGGAVLRGLCVFSGLAFPIALSQIASTFIDLGSAIPAVLAAGLMLWAVRGWISPVFAICGAGFLCGLSFILKFTNAPLAILMAVMLIFLFSKKHQNQKNYCSPDFSSGVYWSSVRRLALYAVVLGATCLIGMARWCWLLWSEYGNPLFPFFNHFFRSEDFSSISFSHLRFVPRDAIELLLRPLLMLDQRSNIFTEIAAPDSRPLMLIMVGLFFLFSWLTKKIKSKEEKTKIRDTLEKTNLMAWTKSKESAKPLICLCSFLALSWIVFMVWSGNGRYFMVGFLLMGPALVAAVVGLDLSVRGRMNIALAMLVVQMVLLSSATYRWSDNENWKLSGLFISGKVPPALAARPVTYLTLEKVLHSQLSLSAHPDSAWINLLGSNSVSPTGPGSEKVLEKLANSHEIRVLFRSLAEKPEKLLSASQLEEWKASIQPSKARLDNLRQPMAQFGLRIEEKDCIYQVTQQTMDRRMMGNREMGYLYCPVVFSEDLRKQSLQTMAHDSYQKKVEIALNNLEDICPLNLGPKGSSSTTFDTGKAIRFYASTDAKAIVSASTVTQENQEAGKEFVSLEFYGKVAWVNAGTLDELIAHHYSSALIKACSIRQIAYERPWDRL